MDLEETANDDTNADIQDESVGDKLYPQDVEEKAEDQQEDVKEEKPAEESEESSEEKSEEESEESSEKVVPEEYKLDLKEGSLLGQDYVEKLAAFAKEEGLSNDEAQGLLDRDSDLISDIEQSKAEQYEQQVQAWRDEAYSDKELGGSEENFNANVEHAMRAAKRFGTEKLTQTLNDTGLGNHPELIRAFARVGRAMAEDKLIVASGQGAKEMSTEQKMYPSHFDKD